MNGFETVFSVPPQSAKSAHGRVNLIGEHTDYTGGYVLPMLIPQHTTVELRLNAGQRVNVASQDYGDKVESLSLTDLRPCGRWTDYVAGVVFALREVGVGVSGFDAYVSSSVPVGSGLSSSAALQVAALRALREALSLTVDDVKIAFLAHRAETQFVGAPVGVMDQMVVSLGDTESALFIDTRSKAFQRVPLPPRVELVVVDSGVKHEHATGEYRTRRAECEEAARLLGVPELRDERDVAAAARLPAPLDRRARHVIGENARVLATVYAIRHEAFVDVGALMNASHASLRDDFEVSCPELDCLVQLAQAERSVFGARMTGGGFGGCIVALAERGTGCDVGRHIVEGYAQRTKRQGRLVLPTRHE